MKKFIVILVIIAALGALIAPRIMEEMNKEEVIEEVQSTITVGGEAAHKESVTTYFELIGNTFSNKTVPVIPAMPAKVLEIKVAVGDFVNEGDVLFTLDPDSLEAQVTQAELGIEQANAALSQANVGIKNANAGIVSAQLAYDMAKSNYDINLESYQFSIDNLAKYEQLFAEGIVSEMEIEQMRLQASPETLELLDKQLQQAEQGLTQAKLGVEQANSAYTQANVGVKQAKEGLSTATDAVGDLVITAPASGYITAQNLTVNVVASNASIAMTIDELQIVKVSASVTANQVGTIHVGDVVDVYISANDKTYKGTVETVGLTADARTMLYPLSITIDNQDIGIKPGMFATVKIVENQATNVVVVPTEALVVRGGKDVVFVYDGDMYALPVEVEVGIDNGYLTQIKSGITSGDIIITNGVGLIDSSTMIEVVRGDE